MNQHPYLVISPAYPPPMVGGSKVYIFTLVEHSPVPMDILTSALKTGCREVSSTRHHIFRSPKIWDSNSENPTNIERLVSYGYILYFVLRYGRRYQAVVANAFDFCNGLLFLLGWCLGIPIIGVGYAEEFTLNIWGRGLRSQIKKTWMKWTHRFASGFIVVCHFTKNILIEHLQMAEANIIVIPPSLSAEKISSKTTTLSQVPAIISVGRLVERKGFHKLVQAVALLKPQLPQLRLHIVGDGPYRLTVEKCVADYQLQDHIQLHSHTTDASLMEIYRQSRVFVLAHMLLDNGDTEGCPTVFIEAGGYGIPSIGGRDGGASDAINHGENGFLVDSKNVAELAENIKNILTTPGLAESMGLAARQKVARDHNPVLAGQNFVKALHHFCEQKNPERKTHHG